MAKLRTFAYDNSNVTKMKGFLLRHGRKHCRKNADHQHFLLVPHRLFLKGLLPIDLRIGWKRVRPVPMYPSFNELEQQTFLKIL